MSALPLVLLGVLGAAPAQRELRVCADPNNLPFSNAKLEGFENRIAELLASDLHAKLRYTWWAQRRGFIRNTLKAQACDVVIGLPAQMEMAATTRPYYRSSYVFVSRKDRSLDIHSLDDPRLRKLKIGVQLIGADHVNTPPAHALAERGIVDNILGFKVVGDYAEANPPAEIVQAVASGQIDIAVVWGPLAGFFAKRSAVPLRVTPVDADPRPAALPLAFDIAMGVRKGDAALRAELDAAIERNHEAIGRVLDSYGIPRVPAAGEKP